MRGVKYFGVYLIFGILFGLSFVFADPIPPHTVDPKYTTRMILSSNVKSHNAIAGNLTELLVNFTDITKTWHGYYGNITGKITLSNANNMSFYDWAVTTPSGAIFAVEDTITDWSGIKCFNFTAQAPELNLSALEAALGCSGAPDCVSATFNTNTHTTIKVGTKSFSNQCPATKTNVNNGASKSFDEILLYEPTKSVVVFAASIFADSTGFDNTQTDFQMLVGVDGHGSKAGTPKTYYFYLELA